MKLSVEKIPYVKDKLPRSPRHASRANAFFEVAGTFVSPSQSFGINTIAIKTMQMLVSGHTAYYVDTTWSQKLLHLAQACLACGLIGLNITIYLRNDECLQIATNFCQAAFILEGLYKGILLTGWGACELAKKTDKETAELDDVISQESPRK